jgi:glutamine synthetase
MEHKISEIFKKNVFDNKKMSEYLSKNTFKAIQEWIKNDKIINETQANEIAQAIKNWAISIGAKHYTHWFQPLNGKTAEKHNTFMTLGDNNEAIEKFSGDNLIATEADASSFPSGGLRATFEARGYVAWDASSPIFVFDNNGIKTLCIPSTFITYNGESVDLKLPLLKSKGILNEKAKELLKLFGKKPNEVFATAGLEQEYFLIDREVYNKREDLKMLGRAIFGARAPKTQQMQDHYFGTIKTRILKYMDEVTIECAKYGIPIITRHNEVAPNQYEFAPFFEEINLANDHNQLQMMVMNNIAEKHGLVCLFHEKPFLDVNGSGKHLNWSLSDTDGNNLLQCNSDPKENLQFLTFVVAIIQAVYDHSDLLSASVAVPGNEFRLGGHEAPPSILSIFLGHFLDKTLNAIEKSDKIDVTIKAKIDSNFRKIPNFLIETTDRNRTSPFAFTGNKFEFRAVGSSQNAGNPATILNTIVADSIDKIIILIKKYQQTEKSFELALLKAIKDVLIRTKNIRFEKDGYSKEWHKEAKRRGLYINNKLITALKELITKKNIDLFAKFDILTEAELNSRYIALTDIYITNKFIEINVLLEILENVIIPDIISYRNFLVSSLATSKNFVKASLLKGEKKLLDEYSESISDLFSKKDELNIHKNILKTSKNLDCINYIYDNIIPLFNDIKKILDDLEKKTGDKYWSMLKYKDLLIY